MVHDISLDKASVVGFGVELILYGGYMVLFGLCVYILVFVRGNAAHLNKPMLFTAITMFVISTAHIIVETIRIITAFIGGDNEAHGAIQYLVQIWLPLNIAKQALYAINNILADGLLIYRCYVIWDFQWKIIVLPMVMVTATAVCFAIKLDLISQTASGIALFFPSIKDWSLAAFSVSLATNVLVTFLIASRLYWVARRSEVLFSGENNHKYYQAMAIIIESGSLQSAAILIVLVLYSLKGISQFIVTDALAQLMGIVPTLIIVRCGLGTRLSCIKTNQLVTTLSQEISSQYPVTMQHPKTVDELNEELIVKNV